MAGKDIIMLSSRELKRLHLIHEVLANKLKRITAAGILGLSPRQISRITKRVKLEGDSSIAHKSRGKPSNRSIPQSLKDRIITLYKDKYKGFGPTLAAEKLFEIHKIRLSDETLRLWLIQRGQWTISRKYRKHRHWRERKHRFGEMVQVDGSHHDWLETRGPRCVLMGYIDDANNNVFARFYEYEGTMPILDSFKRYITRYGIPNSVYIDRHSAYKSKDKPSIEEQLNNTQTLTQFERAAKELGTEIIHAQSAPAKGRIERLFKTFQDRLIKEMRLKNIKTIEQANRFLGQYLPMHNRRFSVEPLEQGNLHRPLPKPANLDKILCVKTEHSLRNDLTILHDKKLYQITGPTAAKKVMVEERISGRMLITYKDNSLKFKQITTMPKPEQKPPQPPKPRNIYIPAEDHPWRSFKINPYSNAYSQKEKIGQKEEKELLLTTT